MNELYAEAITKRKTTSSVIALRIIAVIIVLLIFAASLFLSGVFNRLGMMLGGAALIFVVWYWPRLNIEWEYIFCDGQLDFDMIMGKQKRKTVLTINIENAELIAELNSSKMNNYRHLESVKNFTSLKEDAAVYGIVINEKNNRSLLLFEPNQKMLDAMKKKCPKIVEL